MAIKLNKAKRREKKIEAELQKMGEQIVETLPEYPELDASPEKIQAEFQEILKKAGLSEGVSSGTISFEEKKAKKEKKKFSTLAKVAVLFLVAGACLLGFSRQSEATRMWWLSSVEKIVGQDRREAVNNDENRVIYDTAEEDARAEILEETGIVMPSFGYRPESLLFDGYTYDKSAGQVELYYTYMDNVISLYGVSTDSNTAFYKVKDGNMVYQTTIETYFGEVDLAGYQATDDIIENIMAEWIYQNNQYHITGKIPKNEIKKIIENIFY